MELKTTANDFYKGQKGDRTQPCNKNEKLDDRPSQKTSAYAQMYPNWNNGRKDVFHEAAPQYPVY